MSYKCDKCQTVRNGKELVKVAEVREVIYNRGFNRINKRDKSSEFVFDSSYRGTEHVSVDKLCESCYNIHKDTQPKTSSGVKEVNFVGKRPKLAEPQSSNNDEEYRGFREKFDGRE